MFWKKILISEKYALSGSERWYIYRGIELKEVPPSIAIPFLSESPNRECYISLEMVLFLYLQHIIQVLWQLFLCCDTTYLSSLRNLSVAVFWPFIELIMMFLVAGEWFFFWKISFIIHIVQFSRALWRVDLVIKSTSTASASEIIYQQQDIGSQVNLSTRFVSVPGLLF